MFVENNGNCGNGVRTGIIIDFLLQLKMRGLEPDFFYQTKILLKFQQHGLSEKILRYNYACGTLKKLWKQDYQIIKHLNKLIIMA